MLYRLKYALAAGLLLALAPAAEADTPADTLVIAHNIDDIITLDPAEAYELTGIEVVACNTAVGCSSITLKTGP